MRLKTRPAPCRPLANHIILANVIVDALELLDNRDTTEEFQY